MAAPVIHRQAALTRRRSSRDGPSGFRLSNMRRSIDRSLHCANCRKGRRRCDAMPDPGLKSDVSSGSLAQRTGRVGARPVFPVQFTGRCSHGHRCHWATAYSHMAENFSTKRQRSNCLRTAQTLARRRKQRTQSEQTQAGKIYRPYKISSCHTSLSTTTDPIWVSVDRSFLLAPPISISKEKARLLR